MASWLEDTLAQLQAGGAPGAGASPFPAYKPPPTQAEMLDAIRQSELDSQAGAAGPPSSMFTPGDVKATLPFGFAPGAAGMPQAGPQFAVNGAPAGAGVPGPFGEVPANRFAAGGPPQDGSVFGGVPDMSQFGMTTVPPSLQLASKVAAPPPPAPPPPGAAPPPVAAAPPAAAPPASADDEETPTDVSARARRGGVAAPPATVPMGVPAVATGQPAGAMAGISDLLRGVGGALSGDGGAATSAILKDREGKALQAQQGNATARLLASKGATAPEIQAAIAGGPDVIKALVAQYIGKDKFKVVQTGENDRGKKTFQLMNEQDGSFKPIPGAEVAADSPSEAAAAAGITGPNFLQTVPNAQDRSLIKQLTQYDLDPGKLSAKGGNRERLLALAEQYDPDYKAALYAPRAAALKEFTSGGPNAPASIITNGNTAIQHLGRMSELADKLGGTNKAWILNGAINWANVTLEDMKNNPDLARYKGAEDRFVEEATKFYRGVGGNKADIDRALEILKPGQSPEARQQAIQEQAELMQSKVNALQDRFKSAVGPSGWKKAMDLAGTEFPIVQQHSAEALDNIRKRAGGGALSAPAAGTGAPKPGNYVWKNGALVPE